MADPGVATRRSLAQHTDRVMVLAPAAGVHVTQHHVADSDGRERGGLERDGVELGHGRAVAEEHMEGEHQGLAGQVVAAAARVRPLLHPDHLESASSGPGPRPAAAPVLHGRRRDRGAAERLHRRGAVGEQQAAHQVHQVLQRRHAGAVGLVVPAGAAAAGLRLGGRGRRLGNGGVVVVVVVVFVLVLAANVVQPGAAAAAAVAVAVAAAAEADSVAHHGRHGRVLGHVELVHDVVQLPLDEPHDGRQLPREERPVHEQPQLLVLREQLRRHLHGRGRGSFAVRRARPGGRRRRARQEVRLQEPVREHAARLVLDVAAELVDAAACCRQQ